jgi:hypothetical protein
VPASRVRPHERNSSAIICDKISTVSNWRNGRSFRKPILRKVTNIATNMVYHVMGSELSAGRLFSIALALGIPVQALGEPSESRERTERLTTMLQQPGMLRFLESYSAIPDPVVRALFLKWLVSLPPDDFAAANPVSAPLAPAPMGGGH